MKQLHGVAGMFKVGSQLFTAAGPQIVRDIIALDSKVFLDLKFHDIPHQVAGAARSAAELGVSLFTIHASGGAEMMRRAVESVNEVAAKGGVRSAVLAISVLTSMDETILCANRCDFDPGRICAATRETCGKARGSTASLLRLRKLKPSGKTSLKSRVSHRHTRNSPCQRMTQRGDQKRVATPAAAIAPARVISSSAAQSPERPIHVAAAHEIVAEMENGAGFTNERN